MGERIILNLKYTEKWVRGVCAELIIAQKSKWTKIILLGTHYTFSEIL